MIHVAVILPRYLRLILDGEKRVESRLSMVRCDPFRTIERGERIYFKARGGGVEVTALAGRIEFFEGLTPAGVRGLRREYNGLVRGEASYWEAKARARFATFVHLESVESVGFGPIFPAFNGRAWQRLSESAEVYPRCVAGRSRARSA